MAAGDYSLFFHVNNTIQRFRIQSQGRYFVMGGRYFDSLDAIIERYKKEQIVEGHTLCRPADKRWGTHRGSVISWCSQELLLVLCVS